MSDATFSFFPPGGGVVAAILDIQLRNLGAMAQAQKAAVEGLGALARRQSEMAGATLRGALTAPAAPLLGGDRRALLVERPIEAIKSALLEGAANAGVLTELAARSNAAVAGILQERVFATLDELKVALLRAMPSAAAAPRA